LRGNSEWVLDSRNNIAAVGPKLWAKAREPERRAKISAAKLGKPRPPSVVKAMRRAATGRKASKCF
jgi:hypothetical protein